VIETPTVRVDNVSLTLNGVNVLTDVSFVVDPGECVGLVGANGAGKSSVANVLCGYYRPNSGAVQIDGRPRQSSRHGLQGVCRSFQSVSHMRGLTVQELVMLGLEGSWRSSIIGSYIGTPGSRRAERAARRRAHEILVMAQLSQFAHARLSDCPYGVRKLVDVVRTFVLPGSDVVILDEPTSGIADSERERIRELILELSRIAEVRSMLIIDHDVSFIRSLCPRLVVLEAGRVLAHGAADEVLAQDRVIVSFLGQGLALVKSRLETTSS
jgi:branched-chain amino acid transport system ATP-binding protein